MAILLDTDLVASLNEATVVDIATKLIASRRATQAWEFLESRHSVGLLSSILIAIRDCQATVQASPREVDELLAPLGALAGAAAACDLAAGLTRDSSGLLAGHCNMLKEGPDFRSGYIFAMGESQAAHVFCQVADARNHQGYTPNFVFEHRDAFREIPSLPQAYARRCALRALESPEQGRIGFHAILGFAAIQNRSAMLAAIEAMEEAGIDVEQALAQRWPDREQRDLTESLRENNALAQAMISLDVDTVTLISSKAPTLSLMAEAERAVKIIEASIVNQPHLDRTLRPLAEGALAIAESFELSKTTPPYLQTSKRAKTSLAL